MVSELFGTMLDFYDAVLAGEAPELPRVSVYVLGARRWVGLDAWPPPGAERAELDPARRGGRGPGRPGAEPRRSRAARRSAGSGFGIRDQRTVAARDDVAVALHHAVAERRWLAGPACALLRTEAEPEACGR